MKSRKIKISIETHERIVMSGKQIVLATFCHNCKRDTEFITAEQATQKFNLTMREILRQIELHSLHVIENAEGDSPLICRPSLEKYLQS